MDAAAILNYTRNGLGDYKTVATRVVDEIVTSAYQTTGDNYETVYETQNLPISASSASDVYFKGGRWWYTIADTGDDETRWVKWVSSSGWFMLDSGATAPAVGSAVKIGYTYDSPQEYTFRDEELYTYIQNAAIWVNKESSDITAFSTAGTPSGLDLEISPEPSQFTGRLISKVAQLEARFRLESERNTSSIYVRQGQVTIDTTKGGANRNEAIKTLQGEIKAMLDTLRLGDISGVRIDLYSTKDENIYDQGYLQEANEDLGR